MAGVDVCGRGSAFSIDGDMWQGVGTCGRVWGMWQGVPNAPTPCHMPPHPTTCPTWDFWLSHCQIIGQGGR